MKPILLGLLLMCLPLKAQENLSDQCLDLIQKSLIKSYEIKNAENELRIDSLTTKRIKQNYIPTLTMNGAYAYAGGQFNADIPTFELPISGIELFDGESEFDASGHWFSTSLTAKALLFSGMQVTYGSKANNEKIKAKNYMLDAERAAIIKEVIDTFDKIELLNRSKVVLNESEQRLIKEITKVRAAIDNGLATPFEREKILAAQLKLQSKKMELEGNLELLYLKLSVLSGTESNVIKTYQFDLKPWMLNGGNNSYADRPELEALRSSIEAYNYKLKMNRNSILPKVEAFASLAYFSLFDASVKTPYDTPITEQPINLDLNHFTGFPTYIVGVGFQWDLFTGLKNSNEVNKTSIEKSIAENKKSDAEEKLMLFEQKVRIDYEIKNQQIQIKQQEKEVASNTLNLAVRSYAEGLISITERLEAEVEYQEALLNYYKAIVLQRKAALEVLTATGSLTVSNLNQ